MNAMTKADPADFQPGLLQVQSRPPADKYRLGTGTTFAALAAVCQASAVAGRIVEWSPGAPIPQLEPAGV